MNILRTFTALLISTLAAAPSPSLAADTQFSLLVLAMPTRYHYEYIPVARESLSGSPSCMPSN